MKRKLILMVFLLSLVAGRLPAESVRYIRQQIEQTAAQMQTMTCSFVQTKTLKMLDEKVVSKGVMAYQQPDRLRWEYTSPYPYLLVLNQHKVTLKSNRRQDEINIEESRVFKEIVRLMMSSVAGRCLSDEKRFKVQILESPTAWIAQMTPRTKDMRHMFSRISVRFTKTDFRVSGIELLEPQGDKTYIELQNVKINIPLNEAAFTSSL